MRSLRCPHCQTSPDRCLHLRPIQYDDVEIDACLDCGGLWFEKKELDKVITAHEPSFAGNEPIMETLGSLIGETQKICPACDSTLTEYDIAEKTDLRIDVCENCHGMWLERGELEHAKALSELGSQLEEITRSKTWDHWFFQFFSKLPVEFNIKPRKTPLVTQSLVTINIIMMVVLLSRASPEEFVQHWGLVPSAEKNLFWLLTLLTHQFFHNGFGHLVGNMYFLYILGDNVEDVLGRIQYFVFYLSCGVTAAFAQIFLTGNPDTPMIGASGAISGIIAAYAVIFRKAKLTFMFIFWQKKLSASWYIGIWLVFNIVGIKSGNCHIAWFAHVGGFCAGLIIAFVIYDWVLSKNPLIKYINKTPI